MEARMIGIDGQLESPYRPSRDAHHSLWQSLVIKLTTCSAFRSTQHARKSCTELLVCPVQGQLASMETMQYVSQRRLIHSGGFPW